MKEKLKVFLNISQIVSCCILGVLGIMGVVYELFGYGVLDRMFMTIGFSNWFWNYYIIAAIVIAFLLITHLTKKKLQ